MSFRSLQEAASGVLSAYAKKLAEHRFTADSEQWEAAECLQRLYMRLARFRAERSSVFRGFLRRPVPPRGVYLWGGVGRGKSFLMDCFFAAVPDRRKRRVHFHAFMRHIHQELAALPGLADPLRRVTEKIGREIHLLCFDEFHVSDIADAMILGRLLSGLREEGVVLVATSNYPPESLYPDGLHRERFLPTIALLREMLDVARVDAGVDYRLKALEEMRVYHSPLTREAEKEMRAQFQELAGEKGEKGGEINILGRSIPVLWQSRDKTVLWFSFSALCGGARSQNDYLEISSFCRSVFLSGVPEMSRYQSSEARRFTWLIDVFYEHRIKLIIMAETEAELLYREGARAEEFQRTVSRLVEMRSSEYLRAPVIPFVPA
ncbi:MAG: AFG1 family ATPase [Zoogloeaceae bacterium]|jgi:cell division protein ZapE|nr:AFG1 family ATPase [Zoogloeaceae bacterium]